MCRYCENSINQLDVYSQIGIHAAIETQRSSHPYIDIWGSLDGGYFGYVDIDGSIEINYCPVCGRELADSEVGGDAE